MTEDEGNIDGAERHAKQFGEEIIEPGEPFTGETLNAIRALVAEGQAPAPQSGTARGLGRAAPGTRRPERMRSEETHPVTGRDDVRREGSGPEGAGQPARSVRVGAGPSWRRLTLIERLPGRVLRHIVTSPRLMSMLLLAGVVYWQPWFIPMLALSGLALLLLTGVIIGQDRLFRLTLWCIQRFIWADRARGEALQKFLPQRWHWLLYKPINDKDAWEGPVDPGFEARLARLAR